MPDVMCLSVLEAAYTKIQALLTFLWNIKAMSNFVRESFPKAAKLRLRVIILWQWNSHKLQG